MPVLNFWDGTKYVPLSMTIEGSAPGVSDHGALTGLGDDDHLLYHTDARGDARYVNLAGDTMTGELRVSPNIIVDTGEYGGVHINAPSIPYLTMTGANALLHFVTIDKGIYDLGSGYLGSIVGNTGGLAAFYVGAPIGGTAAADVNYVNYWDLILAYAISLKPNVWVQSGQPSGASVGDIWVVP